MVLVEVIEIQMLTFEIFIWKVAFRFLAFVSVVFSAFAFAETSTEAFSSFRARKGLSFAFALHIIERALAALAVALTGAAAASALEEDLLELVGPVSYTHLRAHET